MIEKEVTVQDCELIMRSGKTKRFIMKSLYNLFEYPKNFETFCRFCLPTAFTKRFADFHYDIFDTFNSDGSSIVAAPRGHGKSTLVGLGLVIWLLIYKKEKYIVYTSQNHEKSVQFLEPIKHEIQNNKMLNFIYGNYKVHAVRDEELGGRDREDCFDYRGIRVQALSFEKNIRGLKFGSARPSLVLLDDIDDDTRVLNPDLRKKDIDKLNKQIIPAVDPENGKIKMIGTILHHDSLLANQLRVHNGKIYRAIKEDGTPLFGALYNLKKLQERKRIMGSAAFESEYMNNPIDDSASIIKRDWVQDCFDEDLSFFDPLKGYSQKVQGVDFAFSDRVTADKSAFVGVGVRLDGEYDLFQCILKKGLSITQQFDYIEMISATVGYEDNALEENSIRSMSTELQKYSFPRTLFWTAASDPAKKKETPKGEFEEQRHTVGKAPMINRLATQFENRRIHIPYKTERDKEIAHMIMDELTTFARVNGKLVETGVHSDIAIALGYALERLEMDKFEFDFGVVDMDDDDDDEEEWVDNKDEEIY